jgi:hypothetical protein
VGLTYREVARASFELATRRGNPNFMVNISRLADIENRGVVPSLHKLYTLAVIYHLNPAEISSWYGVPMDLCFEDAVGFPGLRTHLAAAPVSTKIPARFGAAFDPHRTELLSRMVEGWGRLEGTLTPQNDRQCYGYIGLDDHRMTPILRPGSIVLVDASLRRIEAGSWISEYDRPMYFIEIHDGYRCGWFHQQGDRLVMHPHPLSRYMPETWKIPEEAEVVGTVIGLVTRLNEPWHISRQESRAARAGSSGKVF